MTKKDDDFSQNGANISKKKLQNNLKMIQNDHMMQNDHKIKFQIIK